MALPEDLQQAVEADTGRVVDDAHDLGVTGAPAAHLFIGRVRRVPAGIADGGDDDAGLAPKQPLGAPKTAHAGHELAGAFGVRGV